MSFEIQQKIETKEFQDLLNKAETVFESELAVHPNDVDKLWRLGEIHRMKGQINQAAWCYTRLLEVDPTNAKANYLSQVMNRQPVDFMDYKEEAQPAPFITVSDFLSKEEIEKVWKVVREKQNVFEPSKVVDRNDKTLDDIDVKSRKSKVLYETQLSEIHSFFLDKVIHKLTEVWQNLQITPFEIENKELQLTMHKDGDFFLFHKDSGEDGLKSRIVTFVYYFHKEPKAFEGGDLLLFDTNTTLDECTNNYTKIVPKHNTLLFFPSGYYHKVTPIKSNDNDYQNGRFTLNGWLHDDSGQKAKTS